MPPAFLDSALFSVSGRKSGPVANVPPDRADQEQAFADSWSRIIQHVAMRSEPIEDRCAGPADSAEIRTRNGFLEHRWQAHLQNARAIAWALMEEVEGGVRLYPEQLERISFIHTGLKQVEGLSAIAESSV